MKKIYLRPEIENIQLDVIWSLCTGNSTGSDENDDQNPFSSAPKRRTPAF